MEGEQRTVSCCFIFRISSKLNLKSAENLCGMILVLLGEKVRLPNFNFKTNYILLTPIQTAI